jgi:hypothetical protein
VSLGGSVGSGLGEVADDGSVGVEQVITGHAGLAGDTSGDENDLRVLEAVAQTSGIGVVASDGAVGVDVAQIGSDTCHRIKSAGPIRKCDGAESQLKLVAEERKRTSSCDIPGPPRIS